jgi:SAM-dependent methyltransferase
MADWGSGYVTDTPYVHDYCAVQTPAMLSLAALSAGVEAAGGAGEPLAYCDLGCGQGFTAQLIAAANPAAVVTGYDFNPGHIAGAQAMAQAGGLSNVAFHEASFDELAGAAAGPGFDIIAAHGVFSWVSPANRRALVAFVAKRLKPGGLFYLSYDSMPGWAAFAPLRRIFARHFAPRAGLSAPQGIERAVVYAEALRQAEARYFKVFPHAETQWERLKTTPRAYLAHELLTRDWEAFCFGEVAEALSAAKLSYLGPAYLADAVDRVNYSEKQIAALAALDDPVLAEETRDMFASRQFRRDVFVKGRAEASVLRQRALWNARRFVLTVPPGDFDWDFATAQGKMQFRPEIHGPLIEALLAGPTSLGELLRASPLSAAHCSSLVDALKIMAGRGDVAPALPEAGDAAARVFNGAVLARNLEGAPLTHLASPLTGGGVPVDRLSQLYLSAKRRGLADPLAEVEKLARAAAPAAADGTAASPEAAEAYAAAEVKRIAEKAAPRLARLGID